MNIGFYSPLKSPDYGVPSGDRAMARAIFSVLASLGHSVETLCHLRSYDRNGSHERQVRMQSLASKATQRILTKNKPSELIFCYHCYHKAPDWIGPTLASAWQVPYVIAEASIAGKQAGGRWDLGHRQVIKSVSRADHVFALTELDTEGLQPHILTPDKLSVLKPFVKLPTMGAARPKIARCRLLTVAMMRDDIKLQSYKLLAQSLQLLRDETWSIDIVGDGPASGKVREMFGGFGDRVAFHGSATSKQVDFYYRHADIFFWPGLREAYGMVYLEAQSHGLPVVAIGEGGVREVVLDGETGFLSLDPSPAALATKLRQLISNPDLARKMGRKAHQHIVEKHSTAHAQEAIDAVLKRLVCN